MNHANKTVYDHFLKLSFNVKQFQIVFKLILMTLLVSIALMQKASATELKSSVADGQKIWEKKCFTCHGDSADIARNYLKVVDGNLQGPIHKDTFSIVVSGHMRPSHD